MKHKLFSDIFKQRQLNNSEIEKAATDKGCGVLVVKDGKILTGTRIERNHKGQLCGPGGSIEQGETPEQAAVRETMEEFGIKCKELIPLGQVKANGSKLSHIFICTEFTGTPKTDEVEMTDPQWRTIAELEDSDNLFPPFEESLIFTYESPSSEIIGTTKDDDVDKSFSILKSDDDKRLIFGWANVNIRTDGTQIVDYQKDLIDPEDMEEAVYEYVLKFRDSGEEHIGSLRKKAKMVESCMFTKEKMKAIGIPEGIIPEGWWIGFYVSDDEAWEKIKNGTYQMFSIEGQGIREEIDDDIEKNTDEKSVAKTFDEILKFNPFHDALGRFATSNGFSTYSANPKTKAGANAINRSNIGGHGATMNVHRESKGENIRQNAHWLATGQKPAVPAAQMPKKNYDKLGFADQDDADYHQLYNGRQYYQQQQMTAAQQKAAQNYLEAHPEPGSQYSHSQNMNQMMATGQTLTGKYKQTHDGLMSSMHNIGYNVTLTRYDHSDIVNSLLQSTGAGYDYERLSISKIQKALVGQTVNEDKFLSTSYNDFKNAPASTRQIFDSRAVKINYKVKADTQAMMPGKGPGGDFGEMILAPTNGTNNRGGKITAVRLTGQMVRRKGTQRYDQPRIEIDIEI